MPCDDGQCFEKHIENPTTRECIDKTSPLAKLILQRKKDEKVEQKLDKLEVKLDKLDMKVDVKLNQLLALVQEKYENTIQRLDKIDEILCVLLDKRGEKFQENVENLNKMEEVTNAIRILKNNFGIVSSNNPNDKNNFIIKNVLKIVNDNLEKGKRTSITQEFINSL